MPVKTVKKAKCVNHQKTPAKWRGVCLSCYFAAKRQIELGETTDEQLVKAGFWLAPQKGPRSPLIAEMRRKLAAISK